MAPDNAAPATSLMVAYVRLNRFAEAKAVYDETKAKKLDGPNLRMARYWIAFFESDKPKMQQLVADAMGKPGLEDVLLFTASCTASYYGHLQEARDLSEQAVASARRADSSERAALWETFQAERELLSGNPLQAKAAVDRALALSKGDEVKAKASLTLALLGKKTQAEALIATLDPQPKGTLMQRFFLPIANGAMYLQAGDSQKAVNTLDIALPLELGGAPQCCLTPAYLRGLAYLKLQQGQKAAAEFQKLIDHPGVVNNHVMGALAHLQLGRAQAMMGDDAAARKSYQDFLTLWKDADPDIPIYKEAQAEYAKLAERKTSNNARRASPCGSPSPGCEGVVASRKRFYTSGIVWLH